MSGQEIVQVVHPAVPPVIHVRRLRPADVETDVDGRDHLLPGERLLGDVVRGYPSRAGRYADLTEGVMGGGERPGPFLMKSSGALKVRQCFTLMSLGRRSGELYRRARGRSEFVVSY
jgi:hypothetical protein